MYDLPRKGIIYRENVWFVEKIYDLLRKSMIYRENLWFTEKIDMIYWENVWFNEKMYDLTRKGMIYRENVMIYRENIMIYREKIWFIEKMSWFTDYSYDFSKILFYCIYNFFNVFLIHMCIFNFVLFVCHFFHQNNCFVAFFYGNFWKTNILISYYKINFINIDIRFIFDMDMVCFFAVHLTQKHIYRRTRLYPKNTIYLYPIASSKT